MALKSLWIALLCMASALPWTLAHSVNDRKLLRIEPLQTVGVDIAPRPETFFQKRSLTPNPNHTPRASGIEYDDILRLAVTTHNRTFCLHLVPNLELFHPDAVLNNGLGKEEPLQHEEFRIYRGYVVDPAYSEQRWAADRAGVLRDEFSTDSEQGILGWARIVVRHDIKHQLDHPVFEGTFKVYEDMYHVKVKHNYNLAKRSDDADVEQTDAAMVIYRDSDTIKVSLDRRASESAEPECGFDNLLHPPQSTSKLYPRIAAPAPGSSSLSSWTGGGLEQYNPLNVIDPFASSHRLAKRATGCPTTKKINYMGAAADCTYVKYYQSMTNARMQIINDWNTASAAYERSFNVSLGLITITIMSETCPTTVAANATWNRPCSDSYTISSRLSDFSLWRSKIGNDGAGLWHLMTSCATGVEVGVAWLGRLCTSTAITQTDKGVTQHVSGTGVSSIIRDEWKVVAHEIGHGFGAIHDCTSSNCPCSGSSCQCCPLSATQCDAGGTYIMNPSSNVSTNDFSPCSITTICSAFPASGTCLEEPGSRSVKTLQMCGNGIKETGEDCDTGGANSTCCDPATCKFKANAVCEDFNDNCCDKCQLRPASYVCRPASTSCDLEESCSGTSATCPEDKFVTDGDSCGGNSTGLACASGQCTSRDAQCKERGTTMGISRACSSNSNSCELTCDNPGGLGCLIFNGKFIDGTPCGIGGACKDGKCDLSNFGNNAKNWLEKNKAIAIPVGIVLGLLIIFCVLRCIYYSCCGGSRYRTLNNANGGGVYVVNGGPPPYVPGGNSGGIYYPPPPPMQYGPPPPQGWVNPAQYNGYQPNAPPPIYSVPGQQTRDAYEMNTPTNWQAPSPPPPPSSSGPAQPGSPNPGTPPPPTSPNPNNPYTQQQTGPNGARRYQEGVL